MSPTAKKAPDKPKHIIDVREDKHREEFIALYGGCFIAECSCGWYSEHRSRYEWAEREGEQHAEHPEHA